MIRAAYLAVALASLVSVTAPARAERPDAGLHGRFGTGDQRLSLIAGYGLGFGEASSDVSNVKMVPVIASWGIGLSDIKGEERWYQGSWEARLEAQFLAETEPSSGWGGGGTLNLRYNFLPSTRVVPFVGLGAGMGSIDFGLSDQADGFNFFVQGDAGAHFFVNERWALTTEIRYHHISNAQIRGANAGINTIVLMVGTTFSLD